MHLPILNELLLHRKMLREHVLYYGLFLLILLGLKREEKIRIQTEQVLSLNVGQSIILVWKNMVQQDKFLRQKVFESSCKLFLFFWCFLLGNNKQESLEKVQFEVNSKNKKDKKLLSVCQFLI